MAASNPNSSTSHLHLLAPPAIPMTLQPAILPIWPTTVPTAPPAPEMTTTAPPRAFPTRNRPKYAVLPVTPSSPNAALGEQPAGTPSTAFASIVAYSRQPKLPDTMLPTGHSGDLDSRTSATP